MVVPLVPALSCLAHVLDEVEEPSEGELTPGLAVQFQRHDEWLNVQLL